MAGQKGRSGRKSRYQEVQDGKLEKVCTDWLVQEFDNFDSKTKLKVALTIAPRMVTQKSEVKSEVIERKESDDRYQAVTRYLNNQEN